VTASGLTATYDKQLGEAAPFLLAVRCGAGAAV
jgi:hypothetical protein